MTIPRIDQLVNILASCQNHDNTISASCQHDSKTIANTVNLSVVANSNFSNNSTIVANDSNSYNSNSIGNRQLESLYKPHQIIATDLYDFAHTPSDRLFLGKIANQRGQLTVWESQRFNQICNALVGVSHE